MRLLYRYIPGAVHQTVHDGHSANWQSWCIYQIFKELGFEIDLLGWKDKHFNINKTYDAVFDIGRMQYLSKGFREGTVKILFLTGADNVWRNQQGEKRAAQASQRRGRRLPYSRLIPKPSEVYQAIELADFVICLGNEWTRSTYPEKYRDKLHMMDVVGTQI